MSVGEEPGMEPREIDATLLAKGIARRANLLRQARMKVQWGDLMFMLLGVFNIGLGFWYLKEVESYKAYDMRVLTPMHLLQPAIQLSLGVLCVTQTTVYALGRRMDAVAQLLKDLDLQEKYEQGNHQGGKS